MLVDLLYIGGEFVTIKIDSSSIKIIIGIMDEQASTDN